LRKSVVLVDEARVPTYHKSLKHLLHLCRWHDSNLKRSSVEDVLILVFKINYSAILYS
jgi:hypothetical protein